MKSTVSRSSLLFITDPWDTLDHPRDTSLRLIQAAVALGIPTTWCDVKSIRLEGDSILLDAATVTGVGKGRGPGDFKLDAARACSPFAFNRLIYRVDPPVDLAYLQPVQMLALALKQAPPGRAKKVELVNSAEALFFANEKLEPLLLGKLMPPSCVSSQISALEKFGRAEGKVVLKPLHEAQSHGVELLDFGNVSGGSKALGALRETLKKATRDQSLPVLLQRYLPGIHQGEQRLWFLDGKLLAHARKRPKSGEFKIDMDQGGTLVASTLSAAEKKAAPRIARALKARGVRLAAVDLIDGFVTDYNITSPGLISQMETVTGRDLATPIVRSLAATSSKPISSKPKSRRLGKR